MHLIFILFQNIPMHKQNARKDKQEEKNVQNRLRGTNFKICGLLSFLNEIGSMEMKDQGIPKRNQIPRNWITFFLAEMKDL